MAAFIGVLKKPQATRDLARASLPLVLILLFACSSTLWSDQPVVTARRSIELLGTVTLAIYFASRLGLQALTEALGVAITIAAAISLTLVAWFPSVGLDPENTFAWGGFFGSKNFLGEAMVLGFVTLACCLSRSRRVDRACQIAQFALFLVLLIGSRNGSGAGIAITLLFFIPILLMSRAKRSRSLAFFGALAVALALLVASRSDDILNMFGKNATLSGRTFLWQLATDAVSQKPALGYGYAAFWGSDGPAASLVYPYLGWVPGTAHNGFLEVALNCGLLGEIIFLWLLALGLWRASAMFWQGRDVLSGWPLFAMLCVILKNFSEASLLAHGEADWIVYVAALFFATNIGVRSAASPVLIWTRETGSHRTMATSTE